MPALECFGNRLQVMTNTVVVRGFGEQQRLTAEYAVGDLAGITGNASFVCALKKKSHPPEVAIDDSLKA